MAAEAESGDRTSQFPTSDEQQSSDVNRQDKKKAHNALHEGLRPDDTAKGHQQGGAHAAQT